MNALAGHVELPCACGQTVSLRITGIRRVEHHDGRIEITPLLDHAALAAHFATHNTEPKDT